MSWFIKKHCPVCNNEITSKNESNAKFNSSIICNSCIKKINEFRGGQKDGNVNLDDLKKIINEYDENVLAKMPKSNYVINSYGLLATDPTAYECLDAETRKRMAFEDEFSDVIEKHYSILPNIDMLYSTAINLPNIESEVTKKCIELCLEDISIAEEFKNYHLSICKLDGIKEELPLYRAFYYLSQLYDKLGNLDGAIEICRRAVELGYYRDNSKGGMPSRLARLLKKKNKVIK
jgi:tetratricopeptide (TPR) repeat protein